MKKQFLQMILALFVSFSAQLNAQEYCLSAPFGYGENATGGAGGSVVTVTTVNELKSAMTQSGSYIILIDGTLTFTNVLSVTVSDKTIIGLPGSKLYSAQRDQTTSGILYIKNGSNNVILRNLTFESAGAYDCDGRDNLCIDGGTDIWVDHCDFQDGVDGNLDNKGNADNITITWCRFRYLKEPLAGGSGGSADHRYSNLLGSSSSDAPADGTFSFTWAYNWWDNGCVERMLRCRNAEIDFISCYWSSEDAKYYIGPENVNIYAEGCYFSGLQESKIFYENYGGTNSCKFVNSYGSVDGVPADQGTVNAPSYSYTAYTHSNTLAYITDACGAGATLDVDSSTGVVSSSCNARLDTPSGISANSTTNSVTLTWDAVSNASGYTVNFCEPLEGSGIATEVTAILDNTTSSNSSYTLSSGDILYTVASAGNASTACVPEGVASTVYRTGSSNDFILEIVSSSTVSSITFGGRSSGTTSNRELVSYSINGGADQSTGIGGQITAQDCGTEITISDLELVEGDKIAFTFNGNVQLSYFNLTGGNTTYSCEETTVSVTSFTANNLTANTLYNYQVKALSSSQDFEDSNFSTEESIATNISTGTISTTNNIALIQSDNSVTVSGANVAEMSIYSINGNKLLSSATQSIDISALHKGLYIVGITTIDNQVMTKKIIKK